MLSYSPEHRHLMFTTKCPRCQKMLLTGARFIRPDGSAISMIAIVSMSVPDAIARCPKCSGTWPVYQTGAAQPAQPPQPGQFAQPQPGQWAGQVVPPPGGQWAGQVAPRQGQGPLLPPVVRPASEGRIVELVETGRVEEPIGDDKRVIDNSGPAGATRRIKVTKRWLRKYELSAEKTQSRKFGGALPKLLIVDLSAEAEKTLRHTYSIAEEEEQTFEEELELTVPPRTIVTLILSWKRIWQEGYVSIDDPGTDKVRVPFRVVVGVTFDQSTS